MVLKSIYKSRNRRRLADADGSDQRATFVKALMQGYVIVSGIPASGKSSVGRAIAAALKLPMLDKDEILEAMFEERGVGSAAWRKQLSRAADEILRDKALRSAGAVITSWWRHPSSDADTGTPSDWLSALPGLVVELHCLCSPEVAAERFLMRRRHAGHLDHQKTYAELLASFQKQAALGPLGVGRLIKVNTEAAVDLKSLLAEIESPRQSQGN